MTEVIHLISPKETPVFGVFKTARIQFRPSKGGSMRKQRARKAKPVRFTPSTRASMYPVYEWRVSKLFDPESWVVD